MRYLLNIYFDEVAAANASPEESRRTGEAYFALADELRASGQYVAGEGLEGTSTATTVQVRDGERVVTDGPFAETKEQLGGFYLVDCANLDEAIGWAAKIPGAHYGSIEVRPVLDYEAISQQAAAAAGSAGA